MNYSNSSGEMQYYNIIPQILIEEYLEDEGEEFLIDYKFWCFDGFAEFLMISDRVKDGEHRYSFSMDFVKEPNIFANRNYDNEIFQKPSSFDEMLKYASELSKGFPFVRVDFYEIDGKCIFGEMTLTPSAGNNYYLTEEAQISLGKKINLSIVDKIRSEY